MSTRKWFSGLSVLALAIAALTLSVACQSEAPAPTQAPAKPAAAPAAAPAAPAAAAPQAPAAAAPKAPAAAAPAAPAPAKPSWTPEKNVEFVVQASAGGGSDINARSLEKIIRDEKLYPKSIEVVNRVGGSGAVAYSYVHSKKGDPNVWATAGSSFFTTRAREAATLTYTYKDFTWLAKLSDDLMFILVKADSPFKSMKDVVDAAKAKPKSITWGGSNVGSDDHLFMSEIERVAGIQFNFVALTGGGDVMTNVLGGHVTMASANPGEAVAQVEAKKIRLLASSGARMAKYPDVVPLTEQGIDVTYGQPRVILGAGNMPAGAREYITGVLKKATETKGWAEYLDKYDQQAGWMEGAEFDKWVAERDTYLTTKLTELGLIGKK